MQRIALLIVSVMVLALVACGGDSDDDPETPGATGTAASTAEATPSESANEAFDELSSGFAEATFNVTYESETALEEPPFTGEQVTAEWVWMQSGENSRFEFDGGMVGFEGTMIIITTPDQSLICVGQGCLGSPPDLPIYGSPSGPLSEEVMGLRDVVLAGEVTETEGREIAGAQARCFDFDSADGSGNICLSESGVPLFAEVQGSAGALLLEALEYSETVEPTSFDPPYEVTGI